MVEILPREEVGLDSGYTPIIPDPGLDGKEKTLGEIGDELGITRERARQIEAKAFSKLKDKPDFWHS